MSLKEELRRMKRIQKPRQDGAEMQVEKTPTAEIAIRALSTEDVSRVNA